jgi:hypothetical protein
MQRMTPLAAPPPPPVESNHDQAELDDDAIPF